MNSIYLYVEDLLSDAVVKQILHKSPNSFRITGSIANGCDKIKRKLKGFNDSARGMAFLVLLDLDSEECAPTLISKWLSEPKHPNFILRIAVREVESWVMADIEGFCRYMALKPSGFPLDMDSIEDPKQFLIKVTRKSSKKKIKEAIVPKEGSGARVGPDYNGVLIEFVRNHWDIGRAIRHSDSLRRAVEVIDNFKFQHSG